MPVALTTEDGYLPFAIHGLILDVIQSLCPVSTLAKASRFTMSVNLVAKCSYWFRCDSPTLQITLLVSQSLSQTASSTQTITSLKQKRFEDIRRCRLLQYLRNLFCHRSCTQDFSRTVLTGHRCLRYALSSNRTSSFKQRVDNKTEYKISQLNTTIDFMKSIFHVFVLTNISE